MKKQSLDRFLELLQEAREDVIANISHAEDKLDEYKAKLSQINSAITNLEADIESKVN